MPDPTASSEPAVSSARPDAQKLNAVLEKILPFARTAEAIAQRLVGKVKTLALFGTFAAGWLIYACYAAFDLSWAMLLPIAVVILAAPLVLIYAYCLLRATVGLPQRITTTANRTLGKVSEYRELYDSRAQLAVAATKPKLKHLRSVGKTLLEAKGLGDDAMEVVSIASGALAIANPVFAFVLAIASVVTVIIIVAGALVGVAHLF
jgi:hypothetical protein